MTSSPSRRLCVISVFYYDTYIELSLHKLKTLCGALNPAACVLVSNNPAVTARLRKEIDRHSFAVTVIEHDNSGMEFGAYQAGLDAVTGSAESAEFDWFVVLNDTFSIHECFATPLRRRFMDAVRDSPLSQAPLAVGDVDQMPRSYCLEGIRTHRWVRTNLIALNSAAMHALEFRLHSPQVDRLITASSSVDGFFSAALDPVIRNRIEDWIFPRPNNAGWGWYKGEPLNPSNASRMANKARSILQEKYLSARLEAASTIFIDVSQLSIGGAISRAVQKRLFGVMLRLEKARFRA